MITSVQCDFLSLIEAGGDSNAGKFPGWLNSSLGPTSPMRSLSGVSGEETIALLYSSSIWNVTYWFQSEFEQGRPFLVARFVGYAGVVVWVVNVHLPHYPATACVPGMILAQALAKAAADTGDDPKNRPLVIMGDFNEFGACSLPPASQCTEAGYVPTMSLMAPLWEFLDVPQSGFSDQVRFGTVTCCTKWKEMDWSDWIYPYDHLFLSSHFWFNETLFMPYAYPGTASPCTDPACVGNSPPQNIVPKAQGSWHRGIYTVTLLTR